MARRFGHFLDQWFGSPAAPGIVDRLKTVEAVVRDTSAKLAAHLDVEVPKWMSDGTAWGSRLDNQVSQLDERVTRLERGQPPDPLTKP